MSVEADSTTPSTDHPVPSSAPLTPEGRDAAAPTTLIASQSEADARRQETLQESEELRRRRSRRRRTVADLPPAQKRFRLILLGAVILALVAAVNKNGLRPIVNNISQAVRNVLPIPILKQLLRPELLLLIIAVFIMVILLFPDVEEKVLVTLGFRKPKRPHRTRSSRRRRDH